MNTQNIDSLRNYFANYLRIAFQRRKNILNSSPVEIEHLPPVDIASEMLC